MRAYVRSRVLLACLLACFTQDLLVLSILHHRITALPRFFSAYFISFIFPCTRVLLLVLLLISLSLVSPLQPGDLATYPPMLA